MFLRFLPAGDSGSISGSRGVPDRRWVNCWLLFFALVKHILPTLPAKRLPEPPLRRSAPRRHDFSSTLKRSVVGIKQDSSMASEHYTRHDATFVGARGI